MALGAILAVAGLLLSCGSESPAATVAGATADAPAVEQFADVTEPEATITVDATAESLVEPEELAPADPEPAADDSPAAPVAAPIAMVSYAEDVLPILETNCARCHSADGPGTTHLELSTAINAAQAAPAIGWAIEDQWMPPWPASDLSVAFKNNYSLSEEERTTLITWANEGGSLDVEPDTPIESKVEVNRLEGEERDVVLTSAYGPYQGSTDTLDMYRCLVFDPEVTETEWILAGHFEPDKREVAHHAIVTLSSGANREMADALDAAEEGAGWTCYSGHGLDNGPGYVFGIGGWAPGGVPNRQPEGFGIPLRPGDFIIVQVHYHFDNTAPADNSRYVLDLATEEEIAAAGGSFKSQRGALYLGPAELPCYAGDTHPLCDRDAAVQRVADLYGTRQGFLPDYFLQQCNARVSDFEDMTEGTSWSTCDLSVKNPGVIASLGAHMHELGLAFRMTLNPDTPDEQILLDIPDWDFGWQFRYEPVDEIVIKRSDTIRIECSWNRERAPYEAVGWIVWSDGTGDEMCYSSITTR